MQEHGKALKSGGPQGLTGSICVKLYNLGAYPPIVADVGGYIASLLATSGNARFNVVYSIKMHQNIAFNSCMKCGVYTIQNMMTHTFRGCTHHTPCFIYYAFISLF